MHGTIATRMASSIPQRLGVSMLALGAAASIAGLGTFATFTSTTSASQTVSAGTVTIALGATGAATNRLTVNATGLVAGDTLQRSVDLSNSGSEGLASVSLTSVASSSSALDTDTTNGLQMTIDRCSLPWVEAGTSPAFTYTCIGVTSTVLASRPVIGSSVALSNLATTTAGGSDHVRFTVSLPSAAGSSLAGLSSTIAYSFVGTQRTATNK